LSPIAIDDVQPTTFESLCVRAVVGWFTAIVVMLYRPGSIAVQQKFFDELSAILDWVATYQESWSATSTFGSSVPITSKLVNCACRLTATGLFCMLWLTNLQTRRYVKRRHQL